MELYCNCLLYKIGTGVITDRPHKPTSRFAKLYSLDAWLLRAKINLWTLNSRTLSPKEENVLWIQLKV